MQNVFFFAKKYLNQKISRLAASLLFATTVVILAGCGGGGGSDSPTGSFTPTGGVIPIGTPNTASTGTLAASIQLLAGSTQMPSSGASTVDLTAVVLSAANQAVSGRTVTFTTGTDTTAFINNISASGVSDSNGLVTAKLNLGNNKTNRTITITATADAATATNSVDVTGTTISISGNSSLAFNATTTLTFTVKDSTAITMKDIPVSVASQTGNTVALTPATGITNASGQITAAVTATVAGNDVITATAAGASATLALTISSASFAFTAPAPNIEIPLGSARTVTLNWTDAVTSPLGKPVTFSASRGTIAGGTVTANSSALLASGNASVNVSSTTAGPAIVTASGPGGTPAATLDVIFVATTATSATVQAIPGTVQVTTGSASQTNNSSTISVQVRDVANNLVKNAAVSFNAVDQSGGRLTSSSGITDVSGSASVTYVAGATSSAQNGVTISATVTAIGGVAIAPTVAGSTTLTVSGQSLLVRLGTDNQVGGAAPVNIKTYVAIVTDAAGNPMVGTTVQFALRPSRYLKGTFVPDPACDCWVQAPLPFHTPLNGTCPNEDLNFNGILDPGEDLNNSLALEPGAVASVNATAVTDVNGVATATITYAKSFSYWVEVTLSARTAVTSNDPPSEVTFFLPGPFSDYDDFDVVPPGQVSPFGRFNNTCADLI